MKKVNLKINRFLKGAMLVAGMIGAHAYMNAKPATQITYGFTFSLLAGVKAKKTEKGETLTAEEEGSLKAIDAEMNKQLIEWAKTNNAPLLAKEGFPTFITEKRDEILTALDIKGVKIGEKTIEAHLRDMAADVTKAVKDFNGGMTLDATKQNALKQLVIDNLGNIEKSMKGQAVGVPLIITMKSNGKKAAEFTQTDSDTIDSSAILDADYDVTESMRIDSMVPKRRGRQYIFDIADRRFVSDLPETIIWYEEGTEEGAIAIVAEGALKPLVQLKLVKNMSTVKKAAGKIVVTEEFPKFRKRAWSMIQGLFNQKVLRDYQKILTAELVAAASPYVGTTLDGTIANPTDFHAIGAVSAQIETLNFNPDVLIIHPQDKWRMVMLQDNNGNFYTNVITTGADGTRSIMGFNTVSTTEQTLGSFTLGESGLWTIEEEGVQIRTGYGISVDGETVTGDFDNNRFRIIGELFFHSYIATNNVGSFVTATYDSVKESLQSEEAINP